MGLVKWVSEMPTTQVSLPMFARVVAHTRNLKVGETETSGSLKFTGHLDSLAKFGEVQD